MSAKKRSEQHNRYLVLVFLILIATVVGTVQRYRLQNPGALLVFASGQKGGIYVELADVFEEMIEKQLPNVNIEQRPSAGSVENVELIESGYADLALVQNDIPGSPHLRTIAPLHKDYLHFLVRKKSGVRGFRDLDGHPFATGLPGSGSLPAVKALLKYYGVSEKTLVSMTVQDGINALRDGETDALLIMLGFRSPALLELFEETDDIEFVNLPDEEISALDGFVQTYPICETGKIPPLSYGTQPAAEVPALTVQSLLVAHKDLSAHVIKPITEALFSHRSELIHHHAAAAEMTESFRSETVSFPIHPGALQYFSRNEPGFMIRYAETMAFIVSLIFACIAIFTAVQKWISQKQKDRIDTYYIEVEEYIGELENPSQLSDEAVDRIEQNIKELRHSAFQQLADEKLVPDASFRILQHLLDQCSRRIREYRT